MRVCLYLDRGQRLQWHRWLAEALTNAGNDVHIRYSAEQLAIPKAYNALFALERRIYNGSPAGTAIDQINISPSAGLEPFDVVVQLAAGDDRLPVAGRTLRPCFNSVPTIFGAILALVGNQPVSIEIQDSDRSAPLVCYPAIADREILVHGLDNLLSCTAALILKALATASHDGPARVERRGSRPLIKIAAPYQHAIKSLARKSRRYVQILAHGHRAWTIAWRYDSMSLLDRGSAKFRVLPNRQGHYYGDPFPFRTNDVDYIFVEDYSYEAKRACIAVAEVSPNGFTVPRPVLETGFHLSYPFVFAYANQIWMIPETGDVQNILLYRATKFPDEWKCEGTLLHGVVGYDTTLLLPQHEGDLFWLFVSERMWNSTGWDAFSLFHSERLLDDRWFPHSLGNPIEFDARYSRPAGKIFMHHGDLVRPVQDCSRIYGGAINLCRIDRLDMDGYKQSVIGTIECAPASGLQQAPFRGCHTYNYCDGLEVIDVFDRGIGRELIAFYRPVPKTMITSDPIPELPDAEPVVLTT